MTLEDEITAMGEKDLHGFYLVAVLEDASPTFKGMNASLCPGFGGDHILSLSPAVSVWMCLLPGKEQTYSTYAECL